jgi:hypothetical protein
MTGVPEGRVDHEALEGALRSLGLLYGGRRTLAAAIAEGASEADAVRAYLRRERPHLLDCYDLEALVALVLDARRAQLDSAPGVERYEPTQ